MTNTIKRIGVGLNYARRQIQNFFSACSLKQQLLWGVTLLVAFTTTLYASSGSITTASVSEIVSLLNLGITSGIAVYAVRLEHRLTKLETMQNVIAKKLNLWVE